jgi:single-strand DNA-binding protein
MAQLFGLARLGRDAEVRFTQGGDPVTSLSLAFNYGRKGDDGKRPTQWVDGSLWGKRAEALAPYLLKGTLLAVTLDDVHIETYQAKSGEGHKMVGSVTQVELAGGGAPAQAPAQRPAPAAQPSRQAARPAPNFSDMDDDIPF